MSEEQQNELGVPQQPNYKLLTILVIISLICSVVSLGLSIYNQMLRPAAAVKEGKKVVISQQYDKGKTLEKAKATGKPMVVFFYTDWCGFCQRFAPVFDKITRNRDVKSKLAIAYVNCEQEENHKLMQEYGVEGFPTVYVIKTNGEKVHLENGTFFNSDSEKVVKENILKAIEE